MNTVVIVILSTVLAVNAISLDEEWKNFKGTNGKQYRSRLEESKRFQIFRNNVHKIEEHNEKFEHGEVSYKLAVNKFADLTEDEFRARLNPLKRSEDLHQTVFADTDDTDVPDEIDWKEKGAVTEVKDQGNCGGCWAFGSTGALEGQYFLKTGELVRFSEQYLLDCSTGSNGCRGGWAMSAYRFIRDSGTVTEESYPYEGEVKTCTANGTYFKDIGFVAVNQDENVMKVAVAKVGPIAVSIDASYLSLYAGGVFDSSDCSSTTTNHVVLVVGYGTTEEGVDYWLVKNSWGADWGDKGYLKMSRNKNNQCAIASDPIYPVVKDVIA